MVTLAADSESDVARAVAIIERFGPVGIEDHDDESDHGGVDADGATAGTRHSYPPGTEPGALQNRAHEDSHYFGTQSTDSPPTGNTFEETMGADSQWVHPDDGRLHVLTPATISDSNSAVHDAEMAAYRYGKEMRISDMYRNRSWNEVEPSLKNGWNSTSPTSTTTIISVPTGTQNTRAVPATTITTSTPRPTCPVAKPSAARTIAAAIDGTRSLVSRTIGTRAPRGSCRQGEISSMP